MRTMITSLALSALLCSPALAWSPSFFSNNNVLPRDATDASKPECSKDSPCAFNICCSASGKCGTTAEFCEKGCQSGCDQPRNPHCDVKAPADGRTVGYYESWSRYRPCQKVELEDLNVADYTHINYGFAYFDSITFAIAPTDNMEEAMYANFTKLKAKNPGLQTWIAIGGWNFNEPGATASSFSDMVGSAENRTKFIKEITAFMQAYAFDGVDIDWEYPAEPDRGGRPDDKKNFAAFAKEIHAALNATGHGFSVTLPASYKHLKNFDVTTMADHVDFFNIMSYDLHGIFDKTDTGAPILSHTNLTEIEAFLDILLKAKVPSEKVNLGLAFYGHTYTLKDNTCTTPDGACQFTEAGLPGPCSNSSNQITLQEIRDRISKDSLKPTLDEKAAVKYVKYNTTQWVNYDDEQTLGLKRDAANRRCLGGTMVWAMDQVDQKTGCGLPAVKPSAHRVPPFNASSTVASTCNQIQVPDKSNCDQTALANNVTCAQIMAWNPQIPNDWKDLKAMQPICVSPPGGKYKLAPPPPPPSTADAGSASSTVAVSGSATASASASESATATGSASGSAVASASGSATGSASGSGATQPGGPTNCKSFATPTPGDECIKLASANGIELSQLYAMNPTLGPSCAALQAGVGYCVATDSSGGSATVAPSASVTATATASESASASINSESASASTDAASSGIPTASYAPSSVIGTLDVPSSTALASTSSASASASMSSESASASTDVASSGGPTVSSALSSITSVDASLSAALTAIPAKPSKTQTGIAANCAKFAQVVVKGESCDTFAKENGITPEQLYAWNPVLGANGADCTNNLWMEGWNYCVGTASGPTGSGSPSASASSAASTPSSAAGSASGLTAIPAKPSKTQDGIAPDCAKFAPAVKDDGCEAFAKKNGITPDQLYAWNPVLGAKGADCKNLWPEYYYCVGTASGGAPGASGSESPSTPASSAASTAAASGTIRARDVPSSVTTTSNPLSCTATVTAATAKPSATQVGIAADCIKFVQAGEDDWCDAFAVKNGIAPTELYAWNQILGWNGSLCNNFRPGMYYCVCAASGGVPDSIFPQTEKAPHQWTLLSSGPASSDAGMPNSAAAAGASATIA